MDQFFHLVKMVEERTIPARIGEDKIEAELKKAWVNCFLSVDLFNAYKYKRVKVIVVDSPRPVCPSRPAPLSKS